MRKLSIAAFLSFGALFDCAVVSGAGPFPRLLPPVQDLHLILREDAQSELPLGPSCGGEASLTLIWAA